MRHLKVFKKLILTFTVATFALGSVCFVATAQGVVTKDTPCYYSDDYGCSLSGHGLCTDCDWDAVVITPGDQED